MSILNQLATSVSRSRNPWTVEQVRLAVGMRFLGCSRQNISDATGHSISSVSHILTRRFADDAALTKFTGFSKRSEYEAVAKQTAAELLRPVPVIRAVPDLEPETPKARVKPKAKPKPKAKETKTKAKPKAKKVKAKPKAKRKAS